MKIDAVAFDLDGTLIDSNDAWHDGLNKTLKLYDGLYHDLFHEPEKDQVTADVIEWLDARRRDGGAGC